MKKLFQKSGWVLAVALALQLSGCASGGNYLSRITGRKDDQKLVDVDESAKSKSPAKTAKKSGWFWDKKADKKDETKLAKKTPAKPKAGSTDETRQVASAEVAKPVKKSPARQSTDPFESPELKDLAARNKKAEPVTADLASKNTDSPAKNSEEKRTAKAAVAVAEGSSRVQEVDYKVEDKPAEAADTPEWAQEPDSEAVAAKPKSAKAPFESRQEGRSKPRESKAEERTEIGESVRTKFEEPAAASEEVSPASENLARLCPEARGELRDLVGGLDVSDTDGLKRGVHRIGRMGVDAKPAAPALVFLLKHKDGFVRTHAALALARMQASPPQAVQTVVDGLKAKDPGLRSFAAAVLAEMGPQAAEALSTLAESLNDRDGYVRLHAAEVLIRDERWSYTALETLLKGLNDADENIRWLATYSLAELAPESQETVNALVKATRDPVAKVRLGAVYALGEIGPFAKSAAGELQKLADTTTNTELQAAVLYARQQILSESSDF